MDSKTSVEVEELKISMKYLKEYHGKKKAFETNTCIRILNIGRSWMN